MADFSNEIMQDDDSNDEFEGFSSDEDENENGNDREGEIRIDDNFMHNWVEGDRTPVDLPFTGVPGFTDVIELPENPSVLDFWSLYVTDRDFETMAIETNRYASEYLENNAANIKPYSRFKKWVDTTVSEMKVFIAMVIGMGLVVQLDISEYWTTDEVNETPFFKSALSRDRFWLIMSFFHLADNAQMIRRGQPGHNPLFKLGTLYSNIIARFHIFYKPHQQLSLDEGMVPWRGNLSF